MSSIRVIPLGAGQDVGRSCILVTIGGKNVMFDCGMHMGYNDDRRFPDFSFITNSNLNAYLDCVIISHFHLDHCGALPHMTEIVGYDGPIYMTHPTKAICPILLEDYRKITTERRGETNFFTSEMIRKCMRKVKCVYIHQTVKVDDELELQAFYAGHVLGAAMFLVRVGSESVLYTGDYNMTPDRHLGSAWVSRCRPDLLITESTYATTIRDSKRAREREFLEKVHSCVEAGGKVLIPVFALGRAQELCILLESYWERMNLTIPIYFSMGMAEKATAYYKLFVSWTNEKIKETFVSRNMFDFKHIKIDTRIEAVIDQCFNNGGVLIQDFHSSILSFQPLGQGIVDSPTPMVVFATPGMLHAGQSLSIFRKWAPDERNMVIIPGYCVAGTVGYKILNGVRTLDFDRNPQAVDKPGQITQSSNTLEVKLKVEYLSFSAHADARGIMQLITDCQPSNVMLVHGEASKMDFLKARIEKEFKGEIPCFKPANGDILNIPVSNKKAVTMQAPVEFLANYFAPNGECDEDQPLVKRSKVIQAGILTQPGHQPMLVDRATALASLGLHEHVVWFTSSHTFSTPLPLDSIKSSLRQACSKSFADGPDFDDSNRLTLIPDGLYFDITFEDVPRKKQVKHEEGAQSFKDRRQCSVKISHTLQEEACGLRILDSFKELLTKSIDD